MIFTQTQALIERTIRFFLPLCSEKSTMSELQRMAADRAQWRYAHALFGQIRDKALRADKAGNRLLQYQYSFEEICAKTMYNLSEHYDPPSKEFPDRFDDDSAVWFMPMAMWYARELGAADFATSVLNLE